MFNFDSVARNFNAHLTGQLPWYDGFMDGFFPEVASMFVRPCSLVYDFGASTGNVEKRMLDIIKERDVLFTPIDNNVEMANNYQLTTKVTIAELAEIEIKPYSFSTSILTLSFLHPSKRGQFIQMLKDKCEVGGAFLILEKFVNKGGLTGTLFNQVTWRNKLEAKEPLEQIIKKELGLSGVQFPLSDDEVEGMQLVWAYGDFKAYLYVKGAKP